MCRDTLVNILAAAILLPQAPGSGAVQSSTTAPCSAPSSTQRAPRRAVSVILVPVTKEAVDEKTTEPLIRLASPRVPFDADADGVLDCVAWPEANAPLAFLALDRNRNDRVDNGAELFGAQTMPEAPDGFTALARIAPSNGDGAITAADEIYTRLLLWRDVNRNAISEPDEITRVSSLIAKLGLGYFDVDRPIGYGSRIENRGWAIFSADFTGKADDRVRPIYEITLQYGQ